MRRLAIVWGAWTAVALSGVLSTYVRISTGELSPAPGWWWVSLASVPLWAPTTSVILAIDERARTAARAAAAHALCFAGVLAAEGVIGMGLEGALGRPPRPYWQHVWQWSFIDVFFYGGALAVARAARYYRLYTARRVRESELEAQLARARLQALQMQIRPHFLFNALNTVAGLVRTGEQAAAVEMLAGLGDLLRALLRADGAQVVPLETELAFVTRYLRIEQVRFGDQLRVEINMEPGTEDLLVPNLILQPLVENAIRHGIGSQTCAGRLAIRCERADESLRIAVSNSGDPSRRGATDGEGIGLANTRARLFQLYGSAHRFELLHTSVGTSAVLHIPMRSAS